MHLATAMMAALVLPAQAQEYQSPIRLQQAPQYYHGDNPATTTHECTHWANSQLRTRYGGFGFYLQAGRFLWVRTKPPIKLGQVAPYIQHRGRLFQQYLVNSRYPLQPRMIGPGMFFAGHDDDPLFLFDELSAYAAGAAVGIQQRSDYSDRVQAACEMAHYAACCWRATPTTYADRETLRQIWLHLARRVDAIARQAHRRGQYRQVGSWHRVLVAEINRMQQAR